MFVIIYIVLLLGTLWLGSLFQVSLTARATSQNTGYWESEGKRKHVYQRSYKMTIFSCIGLLAILFIAVYFLESNWFILWFIVINAFTYFQEKKIRSQQNLHSNEDSNFLEEFSQENKIVSESELTRVVSLAIIDDIKEIWPDIKSMIIQHDEKTIQKEVEANEGEAMFNLVLAVMALESIDIEKLFNYPQNSRIKQHLLRWANTSGRQNVKSEVDLYVKTFKEGNSTTESYSKVANMVLHNMANKVLDFSEIDPILAQNLGMRIIMLTGKFKKLKKSYTIIE